MNLIRKNIFPKSNDCKKFSRNASGDKHNRTTPRKLAVRFITTVQKDLKSSEATIDKFLLRIEYGCGRREQRILLINVSRSVQLGLNVVSNRRH